MALVLHGNRREVVEEALGSPESTVQGFIAIYTSAPWDTFSLSHFLFQEIASLLEMLASFSSDSFS